MSLLRPKEAKMIKTPFFILLAFSLASCSLKKSTDFNSLQIEVPEEWQSCLNEKINPSEQIDDQWWSSLNDPVLDWLIEIAASQNLDLHIALTRVLASRRELEGTKGSVLPHIDGSITYGHVQYKQKVLNRLLGFHCPNHSGTRNVDFFEAGFDAEWELDLFGMKKHQAAAIYATMEASEFEFANVWVTLTAEIARNYIELRGHQKRLQLLDKSIQFQMEMYQLTKGLSQAGFVNDLNQLNAETLLNSLISEKPVLELAITKTIHRLSVLLAYSPGQLSEDLKDCSDLPSMPESLSIGIPSELLRRRPDILKVERELAAASEVECSAIAAFFPRISLYGFIGEIAALCSGGSITWAAGPQILFPLFNSKLIEQDICLSKIKVQEALYCYQKTVLEALEEVENGIAAFRAEKEKAELLKKSYTASKEAVKLTKELYEQGFKSYPEVLETNQIFMKQEERYLQSQVSLLLHYIALFKALGGGWSECE